MPDPNRSINRDMFVLRETTDTPSLPRDDEEAKIYLKANNLVILFNDGGTARYMYLPLDAAAATWAYSATEPT